jgi:hypothetical protein
MPPQPQPQGREPQPQGQAPRRAPQRFDKLPPVVPFLQSRPQAFLWVACACWACYVFVAYLSVRGQSQSPVQQAALAAESAFFALAPYVFCRAVDAAVRHVKK